MATSRPIRPEDVAAEYVGRWIICRDRYPDGTYGDWEAVSCLPDSKGRRTKVTARSVAALAERLAKTKA